MFDFEAGLNRKQITKIYYDKAYEYGKTREDILVFNNSFRTLIKKKNGHFSKKEFPEYLKMFEKWVLGGKSAA